MWVANNHSHQRALTAPPLPYFPFRGCIDPGVLSGKPTSTTVTPNILTPSLSPLSVTNTQSVIKVASKPVEETHRGGMSQKTKPQRCFLSDTEDDEEESDTQSNRTPQLDRMVDEEDMDTDDALNGLQNDSEYDDVEPEDDDLYVHRKVRRAIRRNHNQSIPRPEGLGITSSSSMPTSEGLFPVTTTFTTSSSSFMGAIGSTNEEDSRTPFKCLCGKSFQKLCGLKSHEKQHLKFPTPQSANGIRKFAKKVNKPANGTSGVTAGTKRPSDETFADNNKINATVNVNPPTIPQAPATPTTTTGSNIYNLEKIHTCDVCSKAFLRRQELKRHSITHREDFKKFRCVNCQRTFTRSDALHRHIKNRRCRFDR